MSYSLSCSLLAQYFTRFRFPNTYQALKHGLNYVWYSHCSSYCVRRVTICIGKVLKVTSSLTTWAPVSHWLRVAPGDSFVHIWVEYMCRMPAASIVREDPCSETHVKCRHGTVGARGNSELHFKIPSGAPTAWNTLHHHLLSSLLATSCPTLKFG